MHLQSFMICQILGQVLLKVCSSIKMQFSEVLHDKKVNSIERERDRLNS